MHLWPITEIPIQSQVDDAPYFPQVLESVFGFLIEHGVLEGSSGKSLQRFCWCSDGPYDVRDFVVKQCFISEVRNNILKLKENSYEMLDFYSYMAQR